VPPHYPRTGPEGALPEKTKQLIAVSVTQVTLCSWPASLGHIAVRQITIWSSPVLSHSRERRSVWGSGEQAAADPVRARSVAFDRTLHRIAV
jgi:hypothetical protein